MNHYFTNNEDLKSSPKFITTTIGNTELKLFSDNGIFSKDKVDYGTRLLLETLPKIKGKVLDLGCGYGVIGIFVRKSNDCEVDMVDVNERALNLAKRNIELNCLRDIRAFASDVYSNVNQKYDHVITNPPIRVGKPTLLKFLLAAEEHLNENGNLWFVMRKNHGVKSIIKLMEDKYDIKIVNKDKGFYIVKATSL